MTCAISDRQHSPNTMVAAFGYGTTCEYMGVDRHLILGKYVAFDTTYISKGTACQKFVFFIAISFANANNDPTMRLT